MSRQITVAGNWKMNGSLDSISTLVKGICEGLDANRAVNVLVFPPYPYLSAVSQMLEGTTVGYGAQDLSVNDNGAHTGDVSSGMLTDLGCTHVLVGHSERRSDHDESSQLVARKAARAIEAGLCPVVCVGETWEDRENGQTEQVVGEQLQALFGQVSADDLGQLMIAYEPVWAIGTGKTATAEQAQQVHAFIRTQVAAIDVTIADRLTILYGGSVKGSNAAELFGQTDIDGGLIGGASLTAEQFLPICQAGA